MSRLQERLPPGSQVAVLLLSFVFVALVQEISIKMWTGDKQLCPPVTIGMHCPPCYLPGWIICYQLKLRKDNLSLLAPVSYKKKTPKFQELCSLIKRN